MQAYEFMVVPAPKRGVKTRAARTTEDRFAYALTTLMNQLGAEGWDYVRSDALPCEERVGLTGTKTSFLNMLVFRRPIPADPALNAKVYTSDQPALRVMLEPEVPPATPRPLGPAEAPLSLTAPVLGPAKTGLAAE